MSYVCSICAFFCSVIFGVHSCYICMYADNISHFELLVCFWQIERLVVKGYSKKVDQRNCIKFRVKNEIKCERAFGMLIVAFDESTMSRTQVQLCYKRFKEDWEDVNDDTRPGRPSTLTNIEAVKKMILNNRRITIREVADDVGISFGLCQAFFWRCFRHETCGRLFRNCYIFEQKQSHVDIAQKMLTTIQICLKRL